MLRAQAVLMENLLHFSPASVSQCQAFCDGCSLQDCGADGLCANCRKTQPQPGFGIQFGVGDVSVSLDSFNVGDLSINFEVDGIAGKLMNLFDGDVGGVWWRT